MSECAGRTIDGWIGWVENFWVKLTLRKDIIVRFIAGLVGWI